MTIYILTLIIGVIIQRAHSHLRLTFPIPRKLSTDFGYENPPCGNTAKSLIPFPMKRQTAYKITWDVTHSLPGPILLQLLDAKGNIVYNITETTCSNGTMHVQNFYWTVPKNLTCSNCIMRLSQNVNFHGTNYKLMSCADVSIKKDFQLLCYNRGYPNNGTCLCKQLYRGEYCQYEMECDDQEDCGGGKRGSCHQYSRTYFPQKMCFCHHGFYMKKCSAQCDLNRFNLSHSPKFARLSQDYTNVTLSNKLTLFWRILTDSCEIEIVLKGPINNQIGLGWRWPNMTAMCKNFPFYSGIQSPSDANLNEFECLDLMTGMAHGSTHRVDDRYAGPGFASPESDYFYGGSQRSDATLTGALAIESLNHLFVMFRKKIGIQYNYAGVGSESKHTRYTLDLDSPTENINSTFNYRRDTQTIENSTDSDIYEPIRYHIKRQDSSLFAQRIDPFDIPIIDGKMHLAWGLYPEQRGYRFNFAMLEDELKGTLQLDLCQGKCDSCIIRKKTQKEFSFDDLIDDTVLDGSESETNTQNAFNRINNDIVRSFYVRQLKTSNQSLTENHTTFWENNTFTSFRPLINFTKEDRNNSSVMKPKKLTVTDIPSTVLTLQFRNGSGDPIVIQQTKSQFEANFDGKNLLNYKTPNLKEEQTKIAEELFATNLNVPLNSKLYQYFVSTNNNNYNGNPNISEVNNMNPITPVSDTPFNAVSHTKFDFDHTTHSENIILETTIQTMKDANEIVETNVVGAPKIITINETKTAKLISINDKVSQSKNNSSDKNIKTALSGIASLHKEIIKVGSRSNASVPDGKSSNKTKTNDKKYLVKTASLIVTEDLEKSISNINDSLITKKASLKSNLTTLSYAKKNLISSPNPVLIIENSTQTFVVNATQAPLVLYTVSSRESTSNVSIPSLISEKSDITTHFAKNFSRLKHPIPTNLTEVQSKEKVQISSLVLNETLFPNLNNVSNEKLTLNESTFSTNVGSTTTKSGVEVKNGTINEAALVVKTVAHITTISSLGDNNNNSVTVSNEPSIPLNTSLLKLVGLSGTRPTTIIPSLETVATPEKSDLDEIFIKAAPKIINEQETILTIEHNGTKINSTFLPLTAEHSINKTENVTQAALILNPLNNSIITVKSLKISEQTTTKPLPIFNGNKTNNDSHLLQAGLIVRDYVPYEATLPVAPSVKTDTTLEPLKTTSILSKKLVGTTELLPNTTSNTLTSKDDITISKLVETTTKEIQKAPLINLMENGSQTSVMNTNTSYVNITLINIQ